MLSQIKYINQLHPQELDALLAKGWFRMQQTLFTTHFLAFQEKYYNAIWLRVNTQTYQKESIHLKLDKLNQAFEVVFQPLCITDELEYLHKCYCNSISFSTYATIQSALLDNENIDVFNTMQVCMYDKGLLIAAGFFDIGETAAEGILTIYHPDYKKFSLGNYLKYLMISYCKANGIQFFYPGYFVPGYTAFDYKLTIGKKYLDFYNVIQNIWQPIQEYSCQHHLLEQMRNALAMLLPLLLQSGIRAKVLNYRRFDVVLSGFNASSLLILPVYLYAGRPSVFEKKIPIVVFNCYRQEYILLVCSKMDMFFDVHVILSINRIVLITSDLMEMANALLEFYQTANELRFVSENS